MRSRAFQIFALRDCACVRSADAARCRAHTEVAGGGGKTKVRFLRGSLAQAKPWESCWPQTYLFLLMQRARVSRHCRGTCPGAQVPNCPDTEQLSGHSTCPTGNSRQNQATPTLETLQSDAPPAPPIPSASFDTDDASRYSTRVRDSAQVQNPPCGTRHTPPTTQASKSRLPRALRRKQGSSSRGAVRAMI